MTLSFNEAVAHNENLDILQIFYTIPSQEAKKQVIFQIIQLCARQPSLLSKHRWLITLARLVEEYSATTPDADDAVYAVIFQQCSDLGLIPKAARDPSQAPSRNVKANLCSGLRTQAAQHLREAIISACPNPGDNLVSRPASPWSLMNNSVRVLAPVRLDLGMGGISDIPPYSLERYGNCINLPVKLNGRLPLEATAQISTRPAIRFISKDLGEQRSYSSIDEFDGRPAPLIFHQAVVRFMMSQILNINRTEELFSLLQGGLRLETRSHLPVGTGLGASSLLLCSLLQALGSLLHVQLTPQMLFAASVYLENVTGIGGGWEDATAVYPGLKLMESFPETPLSPLSRPIIISDVSMGKLVENLVLLHTGIPKQGQAFFDAMTERYCLRDAQVLRAIEYNNDLNRNLADRLIEGDLPGIGQIMRLQWENWKILSQGKSTNPSIDGLFDEVAPFVHGARMNGSGYGGCAMLIAREGKKRQLIRAIQARLGNSAVVYRWKPIL